jgi:hypothetical protein
LEKYQPLVKTNTSPCFAGPLGTPTKKPCEKQRLCEGLLQLPQSEQPWTDAWVDLVYLNVTDVINSQLATTPPGHEPPEARMAQAWPSYEKTVPWINGKLNLPAQLGLFCAMPETSDQAYCSQHSSLL